MVSERSAIASDRVIFEPVVNSLPRFQQECVSNLMECTLTAEYGESARQLSGSSAVAAGGEIFVQDDPSLRRLIEMRPTGHAGSASGNSLVE